MLKRILGLLFLSTVVTQAIANIHFNNFTQEEGLPDNRVWAITQDKQGAMWIGTANGLAKYEGYNFTNYNLRDTETLSLETDHVKSLYVDDANTLWIGTLGDGLVQHNNGEFSAFSLSSSNPPKNILTLFGTTDYIGAGSDQGLYTIHLPSNRISHIKLSDLPVTTQSTSNRINSIIATPNEILVAADHHILAFDKSFQFKKSLPIKFPDNKLRLRKLVKESDNSILIATNENLYRYHLDKDILQTVSDSLQGNVVLDALVINEKVLVATFDQGLQVVGEKTESYKSSSSQENSLPNDTLISLYKSGDGVVWIGTFNGLAKVNPALNNFKLISHKTNHLRCLNSNEIISINVLPDNNLLISTTDQVATYNMKSKHCHEISPPTGSTDSLYKFTVYQSLQEDSDHIWLASSFGLLLLDSQGSIKTISQISDSKPRVYSIDNHSDNKLVVGTTEGAYLVNKSTFKIEKLSQEGQRLKQFVNTVKSKGNLIYIGTHDNLYKYNGRTVTQINPKSQIPIGRVNDILLSDSSYFVASSRGAIYELDYDNDILINEYYIDPPSHTNSIQAIKFGGKNTLWISSLDGLYSLDIVTGNIHRFTKESGLQGNRFNLGAAANSNQTLYFAGNQGISYFNPAKIDLKTIEPKVIATRINIFSNQGLDPQTDNSTSNHQEISHDENLVLSHHENDFSIEFAGMHYISSKNIKYAYKLDGVHSDWIPTAANNRMTTFSNLSPGKYEFKVRAKSDNSDWSSEQNSLSLPITILPPIWLTWWAKLAYAVCFILLILLYINLRTRNAVKQARKLQLEVQERTHQIANQKAVIESLLEKKNELFANISHEFRTPLTLILGPIQKELNSLEQPKSEKSLQMIQRNANRLLVMVEQILKLAELKKESPASKSALDVNTLLPQIIELFKPLAQKKEISIRYRLGPSSKVLIAGDSLEVMVGNLLSNAIKYTPHKGCITVETRAEGSNVIIKVIDNGFGMEANKTNEIFERFVRLEHTSDISGTGIGLSIVKELVMAHGGNINVDSQLGKGSTFQIRLPLTDLPAKQSQPSHSNSIAYLTHDDFLSCETKNNLEVVEPIDNKECLLIIEDNPDMREYLEIVLGGDYQCYSSPRGESGIELAMEIIPDLVLCDVMMPGIDGYEVATQLRTDNRTSHIPIVLLTAKGDKNSRIKGWDNDIDGYMTKPFDEQELLLRIKNILSIRNILKEKASNTLSSSPSGKQSGLNQREQDFLNKLFRVFEKHYNDPSITRAEIAGNMAVSERQLQRKVKGLVNRNPMDLFRDYRLDKAKELLSTGKQINLISDLCGFSSASYFSQCFKAKFGVSPKELQR
ncbi:ATP-binding protein [Kangiella sp. M94]